MRDRSPGAWLAYADEAYLAARLLWFTGIPIESALSAHRALERYFKGYLTASGVRMEGEVGAWGRNLDTMRSVAAAFDETFREESVRARTRGLQALYRELKEPRKGAGEGDVRLSWARVIVPTDDLVAFLRPRVRLDPSAWARTPLNLERHRDGRPNPFRRRALSQHNPHLDTILCTETGRPPLAFRPFEEGWAEAEGAGQDSAGR
ncbi:MAG: hypothetical protein ABFS34_00660 [Gemmatimonadota bacterium]